MGLKAALNHKTIYQYDRAINLGPQTIRLRPAPHSRTRLLSYSLRIEPALHFLNWIQDPYGNFLARVVVPDMVREFSVEVDLVADMEVYNPFDFFLEPDAERYPFALPIGLQEDLAPYLLKGKTGKQFAAYVAGVDRRPVKTIDFLVALNQRVQGDISYRIRMEQNVQSPDDTLELASGSCRDSALLLVELLRSCGFAARFVSGYLIQLVPDKKPITGPTGPDRDFTDLHAWAEAYVPGAGWIGLDPTSGLLTGEGHIPLAATPRPGGAAPIEGLLDPCQVTFNYEMTVRRLIEGPRPLKPFPEGGAELIDEVGEAVDERLAALGYHLTSGAEPTFVSDTDRSGSEWNSDATGPTKKGLSLDLMHSLRARWVPGALIHMAQGKWYPGEQLPRWALSCYWSKDGRALWKNPDLLADERVNYGYGIEDARRFMDALTDILGVSKEFVIPAYEDPMYFLIKERDLPPNVTPGDSKLADAETRARLAKVFSTGLDKETGFVLPLQKGSWKSGPWPTRSGRLVLIPGDSPLGLRLPLDSLPWVSPEEKDEWFTDDPMAPRGMVRAGIGSLRARSGYARTSAPPTRTPASAAQHIKSYNPDAHTAPQEVHEQPLPEDNPPLVEGESAAWIVRTALCVQPRDGTLCVFFPPMKKAEHWFALAEEVEKAAEATGIKVVLEGYTPPYDVAIGQFQITPDPGVIEVNLQPGATWKEWSGILRDVYQEAEAMGLSTEKYTLGGQVVATGGGCHWILGGPTPAESPFLRRPDLLRSWITYTNRHPALSYAFAGLFIGSSSQAPRVDEAGLETLNALELAFTELDTHEGPTVPWLTDRIFRNLMVDASGNTHRVEICIDKLYSPDNTSGRRGLVEFRSFEMAAHADIALSQTLMLRALTVHFLETPYRKPLIRWGTALRDYWMLPHFLWNDMLAILQDLDAVGLSLPREPFQAHWEFRFPRIGDFSYEGIEIELRTALEPWPVMGEEPGAGGTVRFVDNSVERVQVMVRGFDTARYCLVCRGFQVPLRPIVGSPGSFVAGIRFKAWKLESGLHPTIPADGTLVLDLVDRKNKRVVAGCTYHVAHPAGRTYEEAPINSFEAEARRAARFTPYGHTPGDSLEIPELADSIEFSHTLDVRRPVKNV